MEEERISQLGKSETVIEQNIKSLKQLFPQVFTEDKINFSLLEDLLGEKIEERKEYYELSWAGKSDARKELSKSTVATLTPDREKSVDFDNTQNLFIEGENLEVLRALQKSYFGKIKMIYIDPPYNTGNDSFVYPDNYSESKKEYEKRIGKVDEEGYINKVELWKQNTKENGQYHSVWLSMMYSRLSYAHSLLTEDGVIFISIDDNEQANLKLLCDSIFGEENFIGQWNWFKSATPPNLSKKIKKNVEYILCYQRYNNKERFKGLLKFSKSDDPFTKPQNSIKDLKFPIGSINTKLEDGIYEKGIYGTDKYPNELLNNLIIKNGLNCNEVTFRNKFIWTQNKLEEELNNRTRISLSKTLVLSYKKEEYGEEAPPNLIDKNVNVDTTENAGEQLTQLFNGLSIFDYPKPISLLKYILNFIDDKDITILDFFAGSCTTGHAVMELNKEDGGNRKFICVQMPEKTDKKGEAFKQGYEKISDIGAERLRRAGKKIKEEIEKERKENNEKLLDKIEIQDVDTGFKYYRLTPSHFKVWQNDINENELGKQLDAFIDATKEGSLEEEMLYELILKSGFYLTTPIEKNSKGFYYIKEWQTCIALENFNKETIESIFELKPKEVITLDKFFENNDSLLSNTRLEFKDRGIILTII